MEHQPWPGRLERRIAIAGVSSDGMSDAVKMNAQLMTPARMWKGMQPRNASVALQDDEICLGWFAILAIDAHSAGAELPDGRCNPSLVWSDYAQDKKLVFFGHLPRCKLGVEKSVCSGMPGEEDNAAGLLVEPVHNIEFLVQSGLGTLEEGVCAGTAFRYGRYSRGLGEGGQIVIQVKWS